MSEPLFLGIEFGGTKLQLGIGPGDGRLLALERVTVVPDRGAEGLRETVLEVVLGLCLRIGITNRDLRAVGIGFGGPVDADRGVITTSHQISGWDAFPLADWVRVSLGIDRVVIQNDADTAGLAEARFGAGMGASPVLYVTIGSGIGGGLIVDGQIYRGAGAGAVEIGHLWITRWWSDDQTPELLEKIASGWAIASAARVQSKQALVERRPPSLILELAEGNLEAITTEHVAEAARAGDPLANQLIGEAVDALAQGLAHAVTLLAPSRIILGGGVSLIGETLWLAPIRQRLLQAVFPPFRANLHLVGAKLGEEVVVHGALALASDATEPRGRP